MMRKLLIANRGEIACRIARTARRLSIATVAAYSDADARALHVDLADEAFPLGPVPARESYLAIEKLIAVARRSGADAVHPGYGFLSENAAFAEACVANGLIFVGPPAPAMRLLGSKTAARKLAAREGVPIAPGSQGSDEAELMRSAQHIGFPLLIKAVAGGGGRGMRIVRDAAELPAAIESARRETRAAFGDDALLIEKYLVGHKHVEIQIFADTHGGFISFPARDCSVQRRNQKIMEETPAPNIAERLHAQLSEAAIRVARAASYVGAGTVEFLVAGDDFYFLEMNTRLQVEHPITEMITGQDLVEWQLRIACGEELPLDQNGLTPHGCAIEVRICAEDPARSFLPSVGGIAHLRSPSESPFLRVDAGLRKGDSITPYYDSLIAKLIVFGEERSQAFRRLQAALSAFEIVGVETNLDILRSIAENPVVMNGDYDTQFVEANLGALMQYGAAPSDCDDILLAAASAHVLTNVRRMEREANLATRDQWSPWAAVDAWRLNDRPAQELRFIEGSRVMSARIQPMQDGRFRMTAGESTVLVEAHFREDRLNLYLDGVKRDVGLTFFEGRIVVVVGGHNFALQVADASAAMACAGVADGRLSAPMPATVTRVTVQPGDMVAKGDPLVILEAMKMEITLSAPRDGVVESVCCAEGDMVREGAEVVLLRDEELA